jgi:3-oxoacyl-[acyl-carrier-protein] synthase II
MSRRVVITGMGAVTPLGVGVRALHDRWAAGECGIEDGQGRCDEFDPTSLLSRKEARRADRFTQLALAACEEAIEQAGWAGDVPYEREQVASVIGTGIGGLDSLERQHDVLRGEAYSVVSACAAGAQAIGSAVRMIEAGEAVAAVAGGAEAALTPLATAAFAAMDATSNSGICRPFDVRRDGFVMGEGAGVLVLEERMAAQERGAKILAEVCGYGASADAHHLTAPEPEGRGAATAIERSLKDAGIEPEDVHYVNAHGTSTPLNDRSETAALKTALGDHARRVPVSSTKSAIGHLLGAAGAVEAIAAIMALRCEVAPPTLGHEEPEEGLDLDYVPGDARPLALNGEPRAHAISDAFGFGGHNAVLCLGVDR